MAQRRNQPEKRRGRASRKPGHAARAFAALGRLIARHPSIAGGAAAFVVVFTFVSANAIWYQPGSHPSPLISTRADYEPRAIRREEVEEPVTRIELARDEEPRANSELSVDDILAPVPARRVTSISIQPEDETPTASIPERPPVPAAEPAQPPAAAPATPAASPPQTAAAPDVALIRDMQRELARLGHYDGAIDGIPGPMTARALRAYAERTGLQRAPEPSAQLVERMRLTESAAQPSPTPSAEPPARAAPQPPAGQQQYVPPMEIPSAAARADDATLVAEIQQGLSNIAYADISVDGVAGSETRQAIRRFESDYRLPETGNPNRAVLEKLREIGAL